jgi:hypothetical protein
VVPLLLTSNDFNTGTRFAIAVTMNLKSGTLGKNPPHTSLMYADGDSVASGHEHAIARTVEWNGGST